MQTTRYETYGSKSLNCPPQVKDLTAFESELFDLLNKLQFRKIKSEFLKKLSNDIKTINNVPKTFIFADKTSNLYKLTKDEYNKLLNEFITTYKKVNNNIDTKINIDGKDIISDKCIEATATTIASSP